MLTKEMIAAELIEEIERSNRRLAYKQLWCQKCQELESQLGRDLIKSRWDISYTISVDKSELPKLRKIVGRFALVSKCAIERGGKDMVCVTLRPQTDDWKPLQFAYEVNYRPGKCKIVEQVSKYKSLVCEV